LAMLAVLVGLAFPAGAAARPSVVGGTAAQPGTWPYAALVTASLGPGDSAFCTGVVIAPTAVLTAAHCALDERGAPLAASQLSVIPGRLQWNDATVGQELAVAAVAIDPAYSSATSTHDLAVLQLAAPTTATPIRLATDDDL